MCTVSTEYLELNLHIVKQKKKKFVKEGIAKTYIVSYKSNLRMGSPILTT